MIKPIVETIAAFDATKDYQIIIQWEGYAKTANLVFYDPTTNKSVATKTISFSSDSSEILWNATIPANTLSNGTSYYLICTITDTDGNESPESDNTFFTCYATPVVKFTAPATSGTYSTNNRSVTATISYSQAQSRGLASTVYTLYDSKKLTISNYTDTEGTLSYTFYGLKSNSTYYIKATCTTVDDMSADTGLLQITVTSHDSDAILVLEGDSLHGYVKYSATIVQGSNSKIPTDTKYFVVRRRNRSKYGKDKNLWTTIGVFTANNTNSTTTTIEGKDPFARAKTQYEYALVAVEEATDGTLTESAYFISTIKFDFAGIFIFEYDTDGNLNMYATEIDTSFDVTRKNNVQMLEMLNQKYPKSVSNGLSNYDSGNCTGAFFCTYECDDDDSNGEYLDLEDGWGYRDEFMSFLTDKRPKILKYDTGAEWLVGTSGDVSNSTQDDISDYRTITFPWTEIGDWNSMQDLYDAGLISIDEKWW